MLQGRCDASRRASQVPPLARVCCGAWADCWAFCAVHSTESTRTVWAVCLAGMLVLPFARLASIWPPSNSNRPTFVASASSQSRPSLVGSGFRPVSSPGNARPHQGLNTKTPSPAILGLCHRDSLLAAVKSHFIIIITIYAETRHDTTRHTTQHDTAPHDTTRSALDSHAVLCPLGLTQPGLLGACISCGRGRQSIGSTLGNRSRTPNLMNRRLLHSGQRRGGLLAKVLLNLVTGSADPCL